MAAPKGNQFWKARSKSGRNPIFKTPEDLLGACLEYVEWVEKHPLYECRIIVAAGKVEKVQVPKMRAMTIMALCLFLDIHQTTFHEYAKKGKDFSRVTDRVLDTIRSQKFEGASANMLNANIIARDLGLTESVKTEATITYQFDELDKEA